MISQRDFRSQSDPELSVLRNVSSSVVVKVVLKLSVNQWKLPSSLQLAA